MRWLFVVFAAVFLASFVTLVVAAPSLPITKLPLTNPPIGPNPSWTGPLVDPHAIQGQWFLDLTPQQGTPPEQYRTHEFYDNVPGYGGGTSSYFAIKGVATNVVYAGPYPAPILSFDIVATITNDTPGFGPMNFFPNAHGETRLTSEQYEGTLYDAKLTAEFAIANNAPVPGTSQPPYYQTVPMIRAWNHDQLAWYCWTPGSNPDPQLDGNYYVPAWDFGDIPVGQSVSRTLNFTVDGGGLLPSDLRYGAIRASELSGYDLFYNRTTDLKIAEWINTILVDGGTPYANDPLAPDWIDSTSGDVSVFHNVPEPATWIMILCVGVAAMFARNRRLRS